MSEWERLATHLYGNGTVVIFHPKNFTNLWWEYSGSLFIKILKSTDSHWILLTLFTDIISWHIKEHDDVFNYFTWFLVLLHSVVFYNLLLVSLNYFLCDLTYSLHGKNCLGAYSLPLFLSVNPFHFISCIASVNCTIVSWLIGAVFLFFPSFMSPLRINLLPTHILLVLVLCPPVHNNVQSSYFYHSTEPYSKASYNMSHNDIMMPIRPHFSLINIILFELTWFHEWFVSIFFKKLYQLNTHKAFRVCKKSVSRHFKDFYILLWYLNIVENTYEVFSWTKRESHEQLICCYVWLLYLDTQIYFCYPFPCHGNLSGSCCIATSYLS